MARIKNFIKSQFLKKYFIAALFFAGLFVVIFAIDAIYAWNSPTLNPPNSAGQALYVNSFGNVGIGTTTPAQKLSVAGIIESTSGGIKFPDGSTQMMASSGGVPSGAIMFFNLSSCPSGWSEATGAKGRYIVGLTTGGTLGSTQGTALTDLENRAAGQHSHGVNDPGHTHNLGMSPGTWTENYGAVGGTDPINKWNAAISTSFTGISIQNYGSVAGTNAPYIQYLVCQKN